MLSHLGLHALKLRRKEHVINLHARQGVRAAGDRHGPARGRGRSPGWSALVSLARVLERHRVVVCVGTGGVGKTTTAAALAVYGAVHGRHAMVLTIDPARRLAQSLGLAALRSGERVSFAPSARFEPTTIAGPPSLSTLSTAVARKSRSK